MKTKLIIGALLLSSIASAQFQFGKQEKFKYSLSVDPTATWKEKSPNLVGEIELENYWMYVKGTVQVLPALKGGYIDAGMGVGLNFTSGQFENVRYYAGGRLCLVNRGGTVYPLAGYEFGMTFKIGEKLFVGGRITGDWREDFKYTGGDPAVRHSGYLTIGSEF